VIISLSVDTVVIATPAKKLGSYFSEVATESAHRFALSEIEDATNKFERRIGSGGFGIVYYGRLTEGREIAVKLLTNDSYQGIREFLNEVCINSVRSFEERDLYHIIKLCLLVMAVFSFIFL
jgi:hypothetical protein